MALPPFELGYPRTELRRRLVDAVLRGEKTATTGLADQGAVADPPGTQYLLHDFEDAPVAIVEVVDERLIPVREIDTAFARDEGEGFESVAEWHAAHELFFDQPLAPETMLVATRFRLVERL
jgi:uncharacterized protein YhfF